jgi:hypothetical protein
VPPPQFAVNVFLASVHHLLLEGTEHDLATLYPSVCARRGIEYRRVSDSQLVGTFSSFCRTFRDEIAVRCETRATQTNEVGRCAILRAVLGTLSARGERAVSLLDLGCSAGLNLLVDAYACIYGDAYAGPDDASVVLRCELLGALPELSIPAIEARVGLDLAPIDVTDPDEVAWLLACLWPDDLERFERLGRAVDVAIARRDELVVVRGDMVDALDDAASAVPSTSRLVIANSWSAAYLPEARRHDLAASIAMLARERPVTWVTMEPPSVASDLGVLASTASLAHRGSSVVCVTEFGGGARSSLVAETHAHGLWLDWHAGDSTTAA